MPRLQTIEDIRLESNRTRKEYWKRWGPYLAERQWGTVREDYSPGGTAWEFFPHEHARSRAYRWGEDGIAGISDRHQMICFALALWNGRDPILKERLFGLTGNQGNHGEDVKEYYFYLDSTPTHSYMKMLYKYPQAEFPYKTLAEENRQRGRSEPEFELYDTGVFRENKSVVNPDQTGTKMAAHYVLDLAGGQSATLKLRLTDLEPLGSMDSNATAVGTISSPAHQERAVEVPGTNDFEAGFDKLFELRKAQADEFYASRIPQQLSDDAKNVMRQAYAGMLWSKQFYHFDVKTWLEGDPAGPPPPKERLHGRDKDWTHLYNDDIISMPDKWEYPWYAAWDLAFHCIPLAIVDPDFAKEQLILLLREWYMHPNGQLPAYEWAFGDVNPPVHAWAAWRVYKIERRVRGVSDRGFLEKVFHKLLLNFTWWVNRKDPDGANIFQGGFLGLDNIGVFDRSAPLPTGGHLEQSDGTSWMGMYCLNMLAIALELAKEDPAYEDVASKFFEHFIYIARALNEFGVGGMSLWDDADGFYYDVLKLPNGEEHFLKIRSMVGLIPLFAVETLEPEIVDRLPGFKRRMQWFIDNHPDVSEHIEMTEHSARGVRRLLSLVNRKRLKRVLSRMLDETEFLSPYGVRALSRYHKEHPYEVQVNGMTNRVEYEPGESTTGLFGGNSNWRGPIWFPVNYLLVESLQKFHHYYGEDFKVECPTYSRKECDLWQVATEMSRRLIRIFLRDQQGRRPVAGATEIFQSDPHWRDLILFYEYFHGDNGTGIGASHQTGWTGLVAKLIEQSGE